MAEPTAMTLALQMAMIAKAKLLPPSPTANAPAVPTYPRRHTFVVAYFARRIRIHANKLPQEYRGYARTIQPTMQALLYFAGKLVESTPSDDARHSLDTVFAAWHPSAPDFAVGLLADWLGWMSDVDVDHAAGVGYDVMDAGYHLLAGVTAEVERRRALNRGEG